MPGLAALGVSPGEAGEIVSNARPASSMAGNPIRLTDAELHTILAASMHRRVASTRADVELR